METVIMDYIDIRNDKFKMADEFIEYVANDNLDKNIKDAEKQSYIIGFGDAINKYNVLELINTLIEIRSTIRCLKKSGMEWGVNVDETDLEIIDNALKKVREQ